MQSLKLRTRVFVKEVSHDKFLSFILCISFNINSFFSAKIFFFNQEVNIKKWVPEGALYKPIERMNK
jgi:hypothetical protein